MIYYVNGKAAYYFILVDDYDKGWHFTDAWQPVLDQVPVELLENLCKADLDENFRGFYKFELIQFINDLPFLDKIRIPEEFIKNGHFNAGYYAAIRLICENFEPPDYAPICEDSNKLYFDFYKPYIYSRYYRQLMMPVTSTHFRELVTLSEELSYKFKKYKGLSFKYYMTDDSMGTAVDETYMAFCKEELVLFFTRKQRH